MQRFMRKGPVRKTLGVAAMGAEALVAASDSFRAGLSTLLPGGIPLNLENLEKMRSFDTQLTGKEFAQNHLPEAFMQEMEQVNMPVILPFLGGRERDITREDFGKVKSKYTVADGLGVAAELFVDPFFMIGAAPRKVLTPVVTSAAKAGGLAARTTGTAALARRVDAALGLKGPIGSRLVPALSPQAAWRDIPEAIDMIGVGGNRLAANMKHNHLVLDGINKKFHLGHRMGQAVDKSIDQEKVWRHLQLSPQVLNGKEKALVGELQGLLENGAKRLVENGDEFFTYKNITGRKIKVKYDPNNLLRDMVPLLRNVERLPVENTLGTLSVQQRTSINLPWRNMVSRNVGKTTKKPDFRGRGSLPYRWDKVPAANRDPVQAVETFLEQVEKRLVWHKRTKVTNKKGKVHFIPSGLLSKYGPKTTEYMGEGQNPLLNQFKTAPAFQNFMDKAHQLAGHATGRTGIAHSHLTESFMYNLSRKVAPQQARYNRVMKAVSDQTGVGGVARVYSDGTPMVGKHIEWSSLMVKNQMMAFLALSPGAAVKNTSQFLSLASIKGMYPALKGLYEQAAFTRRATELRALRKGAGLNDNINRLVSDELVSSFNRFERAGMWMFNGFENTLRGTAFNVYAGEAIRNTLKQGKRLKDLSPAQLDRIIDVGILGANKTNFTYGVAGRSEWMARPLQRVATSLQSYNWKFAGFAGDLLAQDPTAFTRLVALHGWSIEQMYLHAGINAESWLGWGFTSGKMIGDGPAVDTTRALGMATLKYLSGDEPGAAKEYDSAVNGVRRLAELGEDQLGIPGYVPYAAYLSSALGILPVPVVATSRMAKAIELFNTGELRGRNQELIRHLDPREIGGTAFFQIHEDVMGRQLQGMKQRNKNKYAFEVRRRAENIFKHLEGDNMEAAKESWDEAFAPIVLQDEQSLSASYIGNMIANLIVDGETVYPKASSIVNHIQRMMTEKKVPAHIRDMVDAGWLEIGLMGAYQQRMLRLLEQQEDVQD
jgi:hypothetical protein